VIRNVSAVGVRRSCSPRERPDRAQRRRLSFAALTRKPIFILFFACGVLTGPLRAHDIYTSWAETRLLSDRLELTLTLSRSAALRLIADSRALPPITPENFRDYAPKLRTAAPHLFELSSAGRTLKLTATEVKISGDDDITFHLSYPRPSKGPLRFTAHYLFSLVDGHVGTLVLSDADGNDLGWSPVSVDQPVFQVTLSAAALAPKPGPKK
jgi:hypothetical protein